MNHVNAWSISGSNGEPIIGDCHMPPGKPLGVILIAHGFKGYKDYGMFPRIAQSMAGAGFIAHRFNFSHSGMTNNLETFERADLFEKDTWNKQVFDYRAVIDGMANGSIEGAGMKYVMFGHSRGGATVLLTAGRFAGDSSMVQPVGIVTASTPSRCNSLTPEMTEQLKREGYLVSPSSRTGQDLRVGKEFLTEQEADPAGHDLLGMVRNIACLLMIVHGEQDPTVPIECATQISIEAGDRVLMVPIDEADHVFNTPNPLPADQPASPQLQIMLDRMAEFTSNCVST